MEAVNVTVLPAQTGELLVITGVAGADGSASVNGPTWLEGQPFSTTKIFV